MQGLDRNPFENILIDSKRIGYTFFTFILNSNKQFIKPKYSRCGTNKRFMHFAFCILCAKRNENHFLFCFILFSVKIFKNDLITSSEINDSTARNINYKKARKAKFCSSMDTHPNPYAHII